MKNNSLALQAPQAVKMEKQENRDIQDHDVKQLCAVIREERAEELARAAELAWATMLPGGAAKWQF